MHIAIDTEKCQGHGLCQTICPSVFDFTDEGYAVVVTDEVSDQREQEVRRAEASCPEGAIVVA